MFNAIQSFRIEKREVKQKTMQSNTATAKQSTRNFYFDIQLMTVFLLLVMVFFIHISRLAFLYLFWLCAATIYGWSIHINLWVDHKCTHNWFVVLIIKIHQPATSIVNYVKCRNWVSERERNNKKEYFHNFTILPRFFLLLSWFSEASSS